MAKFYIVVEQEEGLMALPLGPEHRSWAPIDPSWLPILAAGAAAPQKPQSQDSAPSQQVAKVMELAWALAGPDESLDDIVGTGGGAAHLAKVDEATALLLTMYAAAERLVHIQEGLPVADPVEVAAMQSFVPQAEKTSATSADRVLGLVEQFARLTPALPMPIGARKRGRPQSRSVLLQAVVRAAMHQLKIDGKPISGGWATDRAARKAGEMHRTKDSEYTLSGAAEYVVEQVRSFKIPGDLAEIDGHMTDYVKLLKGCAPNEGDYIPAIT